MLFVDTNGYTSLSHQEIHVRVKGSNLFGVRGGAQLDLPSTGLATIEKVPWSVVTTLPIPGVQLYSVKGIAEGHARLVGHLGSERDQLDLLVMGSNFQKLPPFAMLAANYPNTPEDMNEMEAITIVKHAIGGQVDASWIINTCTIRMSRSFDYSGQPVPRTFPGLHTLRGGDGKAYAFRVAEFRQYFTATYGPPTITRTSGTEPLGVDQTLFNRYSGVMCFEVHVWGADATGHFALWNHGHSLHGSYFNLAARVSLWEC
jgi:hypothetical protein